MANVLVVDDHPDLARAVVLMLRQCGHHAQCVTSGAAALDLLEQFVPDLMLLDVMMPDMDGLEVLRRVRRCPGLSALRVVMFSASPTRRHDAMSLGADRFVLKTELDHRLLREIIDTPCADAGRPAAAAGQTI